MGIQDGMVISNGGINLKKQEDERVKNSIK